jgi:hypothetical protein
MVGEIVYAEDPSGAAAKGRGPSIGPSIGMMGRTMGPWNGEIARSAQD